MAMDTNRNVCQEFQNGGRKCLALEEMTQALFEGQEYKLADV
jgi:hypothetical protein